jgi:hypothetical protein
VPDLIQLPECARKLLEHLYPRIDWDRVNFYHGIPKYILIKSVGITLPNPIGFGGFRVYLKNVDFCSTDAIATLVHEAFHVQQFMFMGRGLGVFRPGFIKYGICYASNLGKGDLYDRNPYEIEAEAYEAAFRKCYASHKVCDCTSGEPVFSQDALDALEKCNPELVLRAFKVPTCGKWWAYPLAVIVVLIVAVLLFIVHLFDLLKCDYLEEQARDCKEWGKKVRKECSEWADQGYSDCAHWADHGYSTCSQWADQGYSKCCDWKPCKWFCDALIWIANWVCVASVWVSNMVCHAWIWIGNMVCVAWTFLVQVVCLIWTTVLRTVLLCWWR